MLGEVALRPAVAADEPFLLEVFISTRGRELALLGPASEQANAFVRMQFELQRRQYRATFPAATHSVILLDDQPVGRLVAARSPVELRIVDIALMPQFRRSGIGTRVVRQLIDEARAGRLPLRCQVVFDNEAARGFWADLGFVSVGSEPETDGTVYMPLEWSCAT